MDSSRIVSNKADFYRLYSRGAFGNRALSWDSYNELVKSSWRGKVCIRSKVGMKRGKVRYNIPFKGVRDMIGWFGRKGVAESELSFNQSMPDEVLILQGEVMHGLRGFDLTYTTIKRPMNLALSEEEFYAKGLMAKLILQNALWSTSYNDLTELLELYQDSIVEFSTYDIAVGDLPHRNTVIWEVRNY